MSTSVYYQPVASARLLKGAGNVFVLSIADTFGEIPVVLTKDDVSTLRAMGRAYSSDPNPYMVLADEIERVGSVRITVEY